MNQSSPRKLWRDGEGLRGHGDGTKSPPQPVARPRWSSIRSVDRLDERTNSVSLQFQWSKYSGCRLPDAPSTTIGVSSLYSGAAITCSLVKSSVTLSPLLATRPKCSAFQSTTIFRLPTPRKPPKSMTAARTVPWRSTITSTMRPISSSAGPRTSRPRTPRASLAPMMVTDGGGAGSFIAGVTLSCCGEAGVVASLSPHEYAPYRLTKMTVASVNRFLARISFPRLKTGGQNSAIRWVPRSAGKYDGNLDLSPRLHHFQ